MQKIFLPTILIILGYGFWISPDFKEISAGVAIFLFGMLSLEEGFKTFSGGALERVLQNSTDKIYKSIGFGILSTTIMQSSSLVSILTISFLSAGLIGLSEGIGIIFGANIGTTTGAWLVAGLGLKVKISAYSMPMLVFGVIFIFQKSKVLKGIGYVGTTITAIIASMSSNIQGKRLAGAHLIFNLVTGLIAIIFMQQLMVSVEWISAHVGIASNNHTLKLAVFHTIFNLMEVIIMIPFIGKLVVFLEKTLKSEPAKKGKSKDTIRYLNDSVLALPSTSLTAIIQESRHLYENAFEIITRGLNLKKSNVISSMDLEEVIRIPYHDKPINIDDYYNRKIKGIYGEIIDFSTKAQVQMPQEYIQELYSIKLANRDIVEAVKGTKHLQKNLIKYQSSPNEKIKEQYNKIKIGLAELLRNINIIATTDEEDVIILLLSKAKIHAQRYDIIANGTLDELIRKQLITNEMATSLMNDSTYAYNISQNLIQMAEVILIGRGGDIKNLEEDIHINEEEIDILVDKKEKT